MLFPILRITYLGDNYLRKMITTSTRSWREFRSTNGLLFHWLQLCLAATIVLRASKDRCALLTTYRFQDYQRFIQLWYGSWTRSQIPATFSSYVFDIKKKPNTMSQDLHGDRRQRKPLLSSNEYSSSRTSNKGPPTKSQIWSSFYKSLQVQ